MHPRLSLGEAQSWQSHIDHRKNEVVPASTIVRLHANDNGHIRKELRVKADEVFATLLILSDRTLDPAIVGNKLIELRSKLRETLQFIESIFEKEDA
jgi:hypothetical protein